MIFAKTRLRNYYADVSSRIISSDEGNYLNLSVC